MISESALASGWGVPARPRKNSQLKQNRADQTLPKCGSWFVHIYKIRLQFELEERPRTQKSQMVTKLFHLNHKLLCQSY